MIFSTRLKVIFIICLPVHIVPQNNQKKKTKEMIKIRKIQSTEVNVFKTKKARKPTATKWEDRIAKCMQYAESIQSKIGFIYFPRDT